jgi:hypothetical protein
MTGTLIHRFIRATGALLVLAGSVVGTGCIEKETRSVMYLDPSGSVTWSISESDIHSNGETPEARAKEEANYREELLASPAPLSEDLGSLGGYAIVRTVLKSQAPFEVHTIARFDRIDVLFQRICDEGGYLCVSRLSSEGNETTLTVEVRGEIEPGTDKDKDGPLTDLLTGLKIVCVEGHFVRASGFTLQDDRTAILADTSGPDDQVVLTLTWTK